MDSNHSRQRKRTTERRRKQKRVLFYRRSNEIPDESTFKPSTKPPPLTTIGSNDATFTDSVYLPVYNSGKLQPYYQNLVGDGQNYGKLMKSVKPLKFLCSIKLSKMSQSITHQHLSSTSFNWTLWSKVWLYCLIFEQDSPSLFNLFSSKFHSQPTFQCHYVPKLTTKNVNLLLGNEYRTSFIQLNSISRKHRFESLYSNISLNSLVSELNSFNHQFNNLVILNLRNVSLSNTYFNISQLINLEYLNVSGSSVTDLILKSWCISIGTGKLSKLTSLVLTDNPMLTDIGCIFTLKIGNLQYIEITAAINKKIDNWQSIGNVELLALNDALKYKTLVDKSLIKLPETSSINDTFILDYKVVPSTIDSLDDDVVNNRLDYLWKQRFTNNAIERRIKSMIRIKPYEDKTPPSERVIAKKRKTVKLNVKKFFDI